jgi:retron-type reverse transcriptase
VLRGTWWADLFELATAQHPDREWRRIRTLRPFDISKSVVWEAYQRVKTNKGAAGVDDQSIAEFEQDRDKNLYRIWNRLSSGSYFPPPVKAVEIPKAGGSGVHVLGVPNRGRSGRADGGL